MVDAELLDGHTEFSAPLLLDGLLTHQLIQTWRYDDDGPPVDLPRKDFGWGEVAAPGWVMVDEETRPSLASHRVLAATDNRVSRSAIVGNMLQAAARDTRTEIYSAFPAEQAAERRHKDALAALTSESIGADLYITNREYLHQVSWPLAKSVTFVSLTNALPMVSLYLRTQGEFFVWIGQGVTYRFNRGLFYLVGTRELLPAGWRWFAACSQADAGAPDSPMTLLGQSALERVNRALELRDHVHRAMNQPQDNDVADDALLAFDSCLVFLMGALDAAARVAHQTLGLSSNSRNAGWQRDKWRAEVSKKCPPLAQLVATGTSGRSALDILGCLRNTVHSTGIVPIAFTTAIHRRERTLIDLTSGMDNTDRQKLTAAINALGGDQAWAIDRSVPNRLLADPGIVLDRLFVSTVELIDALMAATPVELLPNVKLTGDDLAPPSGPNDTFREYNRLSIRWQLGL